VRILLINDDGLEADGIRTAYAALTAAGHQVTACAPDRERSAQSQSVTLREPLKVVSVVMSDGAVGYAVSGTPADCSRLGFTALAQPPIDLVVSGINNDTNLGFDANYSGTVAAALEAAAAGYPALAASLERAASYDWDSAGRILAKVVEALPAWRLPPGVAINLNIPARIADPQWVWTTLNPVPPMDYYLKENRADGGCDYRRLRIEESCPAEPDSDLALCRLGRITLCPLVSVSHHAELLQRLKAEHSSSPDPEDRPSVQESF
jgi:5'-nucleotidase